MTQNKQTIKEKVSPKKYLNSNLNSIMGTLSLPRSDIEALGEILNQMCEEERQQTSKQIFEDIEDGTKLEDIRHDLINEDLSKESLHAGFIEIISHLINLKKKWVKPLNKQTIKEGL